MNNVVRLMGVATLVLLSLGARADEPYDPLSPPRPCATALTGLVPAYGTDAGDFDQYIHLTIHDEARARQILGDFFTLNHPTTHEPRPAGHLYVIRRGLSFEVYYGNRRLPFFDRPGARSRESNGSIVFDFDGTGERILFFKHTSDSRRSLDLFFEDGSGMNPAHVLTARSGLEPYT